MAVLKADLSGIKELVMKDQWKELLIELVITNQLDPWDVDVLILSKEFVKYIKEIKSTELVVPANMILAASILLRYKASLLRDEIFGQEEGEVDEDRYENTILQNIQEIPELRFAIRDSPKRKVTLDELIEEIERVMTREKKRIVMQGKDKILPKKIHVDKVKDIEERAREILSIISSISDANNCVAFSTLIKKIHVGKEEEKKEIIINTLLVLLHLSQNLKVKLRQDKLFGEIFIFLT